MRFLAGVLLVVGSVLLGAKIVSGADQSTTVWKAQRDLPAGTTVGAADFALARVRLFGDHATYRSAASGSPQSLVLSRPIGRDEFLPASALRDDDQSARATTREISVPLENGHYPADLAAGDTVDVYVTSKPPGGESQPLTKLVLERAVVSAIPQGKGGGFSSSNGKSAVILVPADRVADVVSAVQDGKVDIAGRSFED